MASLEPVAVPVDFRTDPSRYKHWKLCFDGPVATLALDVDEEGGIRSGYKLKLNSYDLGVDIELHDALQRIRFEHPEVRAVVLTSSKERVFSSGANIFMLGMSSHAWKVNFCKFTNETRNGIEDASRHSGLKFLAAVNGACAGGGYELAMACDEIWLVDDRSSSVALPEVPLLGVLPGTGGLTRLTDKRKVRHDRADLFCTVVEGIRGERAKQWRLVDEVVKPSQFAQAVQARALELAAQSDRPCDARGVALTPIERSTRDNGIAYQTLAVTLDRAARIATLTAKAPCGPQPADIDAIVAAGANWWPLRFGRELDDAILSLRTNEGEIGTWILRTSGDARAVLDVDAALVSHRDHWFVRETIGLLRRALARIDVSSRSLFALIESGSCFVGILAELAFAADRSYMQALPDNPSQQPAIVLSEANFGLYPMVTRQPRLARRFYGDDALFEALRDKIGMPVDPLEAERLGLVTAAPDDLDWPDEIRIALEERAAMSPDALTGLEANLRFNGPETMESRIFGRLSAWQNWIFNRPNAAGDKGALKAYGKGAKPQFDVARV
ncbi:MULTISPECIES: 2,3-epoxybenzoyl-CoA dihydrolase [Burkholderiaceae]|uniref:2,3-epoxybenzoyl-CoA dihydrolase n=1 Tax=Burkholderiaceae TaxID=119060 RepID=UPI0009613845|nr:MULTISPECIES: 2,3-epoxybenzoyl-CoA dihydrolase [Burkholderiaceae]MCG1019705.1 2,3-epoxybenzoyl-CoA dihydrolase [Mycetohabitans sp. B4]SIT78893.1 benzoyl-CoA-dihydrodiol lyase [Burkholderia sp. b13]